MIRRIKVLNVNQLLDPIIGGGTAERTIQMSYFLADQGVDCTILTIDTKIDDSILNYLTKVKIIAIPYVLKRFYLPLSSFMKISELVKYVDVIHLMSHWTVINIWVYFFAILHKKPYVICPAGALPIFGRSKIIKRIYNFIIGNKIVINAAWCIAVTNDEIKCFQDYGVDIGKVIVIPNGILTNFSHPNIEHSFRKKFDLVGKQYIFFIGRLNPIKGIDLLIDAFCQLKNRLENYHLVIAGTDEGLLKDLKRVVLLAGLIEKVHFIGFIKGEEKRQAYKSADLLVIPSRQEAMSIVVLEAGVFGTPVLITDQCGFDEINVLECGLVVSADLVGLTNGLLAFVKSETKLSEEGSNLKSLVLTNYDWQQIVVKYLDLYEKVLHPRN